MHEYQCNGGNNYCPHINLIWFSVFFINSIKRMLCWWNNRWELFLYSPLFSFSMQNICTKLFQLPLNNNMSILQKRKYVKFLRSLVMWSASRAHAGCIFQTLSLALAFTYFNENACLYVLSCQCFLFVKLSQTQSSSIAWTVKHSPMNQPRETKEIEKKKSQTSSKSEKKK